jgi:hypothetical protein
MISHKPEAYNSNNHGNVHGYEQQGMPTPAGLNGLTNLFSTSLKSQNPVDLGVKNRIQFGLPVGDPREKTLQNQIAPHALSRICFLFSGFSLFMQA